MLASSPINSSPTTTTPTTAGSNVITPNSTGIFPLNNPITSNKFLTKQDREALLQYTKHFTRKAVQIIVQSRLGDKKPTKSRVYAYNADWFNLSIKDLAQITNMTKTSLGNVETLFNVNSPFCIEISLRTPENQTMILETWCILFNDQLVDSTQKVCYSVYKKMSSVLRSLMCITRSIPTYQLSRRQNSDTYVLLYRMYCGEPIVHHLGENYATAKVGTIGTPIGSIIVNVAYRTRLTMTPQNSQNSNEYTGGIQIKDDHFIPEHIERRQMNYNYNNIGESPSARYPNRTSSTDLTEYSNSPSSPPLINDKSPRSVGGGGISFEKSSSSSSLSRRSSSNLNTIAETTRAGSNQQQFINNNNIPNRQSSKTQPIPMKSSNSQPFDTINSNNQNLQLQRYSNQPDMIGHTAHQQNDESSADEYNSSSVASTPDTIYYFKLKSAAFVPSASFSNNYFSSSICNLNNENDLPPFITLLSNDFANISASDAKNQQLQQFNQQQQQQQINQFDQTAQSPPPPHNMMEYNYQQKHMLTNRQIKYLNNEEQLASPCSLPNFKMLEFQNQQFLNTNNTETKLNNTISSIATNPAVADDFVFIESKKIAFGLSNAADDLRTFFRACENAPILDSFQNEPSFNDILKDLDQQLLVYESKVAEFDDLIKSLENN